MTDDRTRKAILARRARFLAAALTALPAAACEKDKEAIGPDDAGTKATSSQPLDVLDAATDAGPDVHDAGRPRVCLKMAMPRDAGAAPHACLRKAIVHD